MKVNLLNAIDAYRESKLWEKLDGIFIVRVPEVAPLYVRCVSRGDDLGALEVYLGDEGYAAGLALQDAKDDFARYQAILDQRLLYFDWVKAGEMDAADRKILADPPPDAEFLPIFRRLMPGSTALRVKDDMDWNILRIALKAALQLDESIEARPPSENALPMLSWTGNGFERSEQPLPLILKVAYPVARLQSDLDAARLRRKGTEKGLVYMCDLFYEPVALKDEGVQGVPRMLLVLDAEDGAILALRSCEDPDCYETDLADDFLDLIGEEKFPEQIVVRNAQTFAFFSGICEQIGVSLVMREELAPIEAVEAEIFSAAERLARKAEELAKQPSPKKGPAICAFCGRALGATAVWKHVKNCEARDLHPGEQAYLALQVSGADEPAYYLYLEVMADATLRRLDRFLRDLWLECCGHMSAFTIDGVDYLSYAEFGERGMNARVGNLLKKGQNFSYVYDFGSETRLKLRVVDVYLANRRRDKITLLARNAPVESTCVVCGKPAQWVDAADWRPIRERVYCDQCAEERAMEALLPIVNSPRCGTCAYGHLDDE